MSQGNVGCKDKLAVNFMQVGACLVDLYSNVILGEYFSVRSNEWWDTRRFAPFLAGSNQSSRGQRKDNQPSP
jgi:hypothetical protein